MSQALYEVGTFVILGAEKKDSGWYYLVKWFKYPERKNSWEPSENFKTCERSISSFWNHLNINDNLIDNHGDGYLIMAKADWIESERLHFARVYGAGNSIHNHSARHEGERGSRLTIKLPHRGVKRPRLTITIPGSKKC